MGITDEIKARLDIVDVVVGYVPELRRSGRTYQAPCPFHQERTPSFKVFPDTQTWRCFGACAAGGDVFGFVMRAERTDYAGALRTLAARAGVALEERRPARPAEDPLYAANDAAQQFFRDAFIADRGAQARAYAEGRGITDEAVARFGVGYAPSTGDELLRRLVALGIGEDLLVRAGLVLRGEGGASRDMFHGRLTFPLRDVDGRIAGFAGRALDGANPKYINTPQTPVFDKGRMLYALDRAKGAIGAEGVAVVVEGYMDVIAAHEHGYRNVVASMGTALTEQQVALLRARAQRIVLALDADAAGQEAMLRSLRTSWSLVGSAVAAGRRRVDVLSRPDDLSTLRVALIAGGKDPDEIIRTDPAHWQRLIAEAKPAVEFLIEAEAARMDLSTAQGKSSAVERLMPVVFAIPNWADQERSFQRVADLVGIEASALAALVGRMGGQFETQRRALRPRADAAPVESVFTVAERDPLEERTLALLAQDEELVERAHEAEVGHFERAENQAVLHAIQEAGTMEGALARLDGSLADQLVRLSQEALPPADRRLRAAEWEECLRRLEERHLRRLKAQEGAALSASAAEDAPRDPAYLEAVSRQALRTNERLRDIFAGGASQRD